MHFFVQRDMDVNCTNRTPSTAALICKRPAKDVSSVYSNPAVMTPILRGVSAAMNIFRVSGCCEEKQVVVKANQVVMASTEESKASTPVRGA